MIDWLPPPDYTPVTPLLIISISASSTLAGPVGGTTCDEYVTDIQLGPEIQWYTC
jgi:hypothetical protein